MYIYRINEIVKCYVELYDDGGCIASQKYMVHPRYLVHDDEFSQQEFCGLCMKILNEIPEDVEYENYIKILTSNLINTNNFKKIKTDATFRFSYNLE